jgi:hypothetical protein
VMCGGRLDQRGERRWGALLAFDIRLEVGDNTEQQSRRPSDLAEDLGEVSPLPVVVPMSGVAVMQEAIKLLIVVEPCRCIAGQALVAEWPTPATPVRLRAVWNACPNPTDATR